jgi:hypothetical protein
MRPLECKQLNVNGRRTIIDPKSSPWACSGELKSLNIFQLISEKLTTYMSVKKNSLVNILLKTYFCKRIIYVHAYLNILNLHKQYVYIKHVIENVLKSLTAWSICHRYTASIIRHYTVCRLLINFLWYTPELDHELIGPLKKFRNLISQLLRASIMLCLKYCFMGHCSNRG